MAQLIDRCDKQELSEKSALSAISMLELEMEDYRVKWDKTHKLLVEELLLFRYTLWLTMAKNYFKLDAHLLKDNIDIVRM